MLFPNDIGVLLVFRVVPVAFLPAAKGLEYAFRSKLEPRANDLPSLCAAGDIAARRAEGVELAGILARFAFRGVVPCLDANVLHSEMTRYLVTDVA